ncbi:hypothetical protein [Maribacter sp. 4G9]|uniref:hypothetical protein n=1 Tax=Maribacter sp. 4G9 TaxID=1889777 RepID=UPI000C15A355|nr:hypothetical protein [Maribacter sp. 4G9]PIB38303.1 hypothetical protein BFP75_17105 [Maribacter sp. 4G9]
MSFLKSAINQVGRDMGKVVSNQVFNNSHSTPYRRVSQNARLKTTAQNKSLKSDFDKAIDFQTGHRPSTLIAKISGVYTVIKNEANQYISDGYLDTSESASLFEMMNRFNMKIDDVCDVLEIDEVANEKEINQLITIVDKTNKLFKETLKVSADGCIERKSEHEIEATKIENVSFLNYVGLHLIWMGKYARGQEKNVWKAVLANIFDIITITFPVTRVYLLLKGVFTFPSESKRRITLKNAHNKLAELEGKRAESYLNIG